MAALWPGIGKHEVEDRDAVLREEAFHRVRNLDAQDVRVRKTGALDFAAGCANAAQKAFDSQKISVRICSGRGSEKRSVAATEIYLDRCSPAKDCPQVERLETIRRDELDLACYG